MDDLTKKQKGFVLDYVQTENGTQSALKNYDTDDARVASVIAAENLTKPSIQEAIAEVKASIAEQIPDDLLVRVHLEGLNASRTIKSGDEGEIVEPDYATRHKYLDTAHKLKGTYAPEKSISLNMNANIANPKARELAEKYEDELKKNL